MPDKCSCQTFRAVLKNNPGSIEEYYVVVEQSNNWPDTLRADYRRFAYLTSKRAETGSIRNIMSYITNYLKAHMDSLFRKYRSRFMIHIANSAKIQCPYIEMIIQNQHVVKQQKVTYFPLLINKTNLNYRKCLNRSDSCKNVRKMVLI
jgi:hypothetical protein